MIQCPNCYAQNVDGSTYCYNCRSPLTHPVAGAYYAQPAATAVAMSPPTSTTAIVSLILGILGLVGVLPLIGSIIGAILGHMALRDIRARPGQVSGEGMARAGQIISYVGIALWALVVLCVCLYIVGVFAIVGLGAASSSAG